MYNTNGTGEYLKIRERYNHDVNLQRMGYEPETCACSRSIGWAI